MKKFKGITLITLVVTVIVLLILATISINLVFGENGIISRSRQASIAYTVAREKEALSIAYTGCQTENFVENVTKENLQNELDRNGEDTTVEEVADGLKIKFNDTNHEYTINQDGEIEEGDIVVADDEKQLNYGVICINYETRFPYQISDSGNLKIYKEATKDYWNKADEVIIEANNIKRVGNHCYIDKEGNIYGYTYNSANKTITVKNLSTDSTSELYNKKINKICVYEYGNQEIVIDNEGKIYGIGNNSYNQLGFSESGVYNYDHFICISDKVNSIFKNKKISNVYMTQNASYFFDGNGGLYETQDYGDGNPICLTQTGDLNGKIVKKMYEINNQSGFFAIDSQGNLYAWGNNYDNTYLATGDSEMIYTPKLVSNINGSAIKGKRINSLSDSGNNIYAIDTEGKLYGWGYNWGELGIGNEEKQSLPICISDVSGSIIKGKKIKQVDHWDVVLDESNKKYKLGGTNNMPVDCTNGYDGAQFDLPGKLIVNSSYSLYLDNQGNVYSRQIYGTDDIITSTMYNNYDGNQPMCFTTSATSPIYGKKIKIIDRDFIITEEGQLYYYKHIVG